MAHITGTDRTQYLLLPERVEDYVGPDNPVRFIDAFVDGLDLGALGFARVKAKATGRPGYDPADMLKLYLYGYLNRVRSSRRLEAETHRNLEVIWLLRQLTPDFKTIADFRKTNRSAFKPVFREFVLFCRELGLYGGEVLSVDGTRLKAVNNKDRNFTQATIKRDLARIDARLDQYLQALNAADHAESAPEPGDKTALQDKIAALQARRERLGSYAQIMVQSGETQISLTDPDSRAMPAKSGVGVGYNAQIAVDAKHHLIAEQTVCNKGSDLGLLTQTAEAAQQNLKLETQPIAVVADRGYFKAEDIEACEQAGMVPYVPKPQRGRTGRFAKSAFRYDAARDVYICPADQVLEHKSTTPLRDTTTRHYWQYNACQNCPLKPKCTTGKMRQICRYENEAALEQMAERLADNLEMLAIRRQSVEHPFGSIKQWMNQGAFLMRRLENVRAEFSLTSLAYNMRRAINLVGVSALIEASKIQKATAPP